MNVSANYRRHTVQPSRLVDRPIITCTYRPNRYRYLTLTKEEQLMSSTPEDFTANLTMLVAEVRGSATRIDTEQKRCAAAVVKLETQIATLNTESAKKITVIEESASDGIRKLRDECLLNAQVIAAMTGIPEQQVKKALTRVADKKPTPRAPAATTETHPEPTSEQVWETTNGAVPVGSEPVTMQQQAADTNEVAWAA
jgi:hypothetical protein